MSGLIINPYIVGSGGGGGGGGGNPTLANAWKAVGNSGSTLNCTVSPSAGSCLAVAVAEYESTADNTSISDNIGSTSGWTKVIRAVNSLGCVVLWYKANIPSGITTVTLTRSTGATYYNIHVHEITGADTSTPFTSGEYSTATGSGSTGNTGTVTTATAKSVLVAITTPYDDGGNPSTLTLNASGTSGATWSHFNSASKEDNGSVNLVSSNPTAAVTTTGARIHHWTFAGSRSWASAMMAIH
jgi:hypothetical protein